MKLFRSRNPEHNQYLGWEDYEEMIATMELFAWQQSTRKQSLKNALATV